MQETDLREEDDVRQQQDDKPGMMMVETQKENLDWSPDQRVVPDAF